jgi:hypothetical protein
LESAQELVAADSRRYELEVMGHGGVVDEAVGDHDGGLRVAWDRESESGRVLSMVGGDAAVGGFMAGIEWVLTGSRDIPGVYLISSRLGNVGMGRGYLWLTS